MYKYILIRSDRVNVIFHHLVYLILSKSMTQSHKITIILKVLPQLSSPGSIFPNSLQLFNDIVLLLFYFIFSVHLHIFNPFEILNLEVLHASLWSLIGDPINLSIYIIYIYIYIYIDGNTRTQALHFFNFSMHPVLSPFHGHRNISS